MTTLLAGGAHGLAAQAQGHHCSGHTVPVLQPPVTWPCARRARHGGGSLRDRARPRAVSLRPTLAEQPALQHDVSPPQLLHMEERPEGGVPIYVAIESDVLSPHNTLGYEEALRVGLKAVRLVGVTGIAVDVLWGLVEQAGPQQYDWAGYRKLFNIIVDMGFKLKVNLCFNSTDSVGLPAWLVQLGQINPDLWYADKSGERCMECLSLGVNDVPVVGGRSGVQVYADLMQSFRQEFGPLLASGAISEVLIGLGPRSEARYPSHPPTAPGSSGPKRWEYPGVGEFQCYDKYMLSSLKACSEQVRQPPWGLGGPHDAGPYTLWPHQSTFFAHNGSWTSPYGRFFLQWYSDMLVVHMERVMGAAAHVFAGLPVLLNARIPGCYWWFNTASHAPELTAGYYNTSTREGYLQPFKTLAAYGAGVHLGLAEAQTSEKSSNHCADPERLLLTQRTVAAALHMPVTVENSEARFDDPALARLHSTLFDPGCYLGIELPAPRALVFNRMSDLMFEPNNWQRFKAFIRKVHAQAEDPSLRVASSLASHAS